MGENDNKEDVIELWGRQFNIAKKGLDETQVVPFVDELISQRDRLIQQEEHLTSLTKLAEKTVTEADKLAKEIKEEATEQTKDEASVIIAKAEEQAQQIVEEKRAEIVTVATEQAEAIKADAEHEAELLIENHKKRLQPELKDMAQRVCDQLLSQLESLKQQVTTLEAEFEHRLSQPLEETSIATMEKEPPLAQVPATIQQEDNITQNISSELSLEPTADIPTESQELIQSLEPTNTRELEEQAPSGTEDTTIYEGEVEVEILPPINIRQIIKIMGYLEGLPEVSATELIPISDKPLIIASLSEPLPLMDILKTLPEVAEVKEVTDEETVAGADTTPAEGQRRKIQISLSEEK